MENENETKEIQITENNIKIPIYLNGEKYLVNIYPSKDNINIIFKLLKEKNITFYFFAKFDLKDFKKLSSLFSEDVNIVDIFSHLKLISKKYIINLLSTRKENKMIISFQINENKQIKFPLIKKIVIQKKLNPLIEEQIGENKIKLKSLKNQVIKMNKSLNIKNTLIQSLNETISTLNEKLNNISVIHSNNITNNNNSVISTKHSSSIETFSNSENNSCKDEYQDDNKKENNSKNNLTDKKKEEKNNNNPNTLFCYDKSQNKKIIEFLIILNIVTILIVLYILGSNYNFRINFEYDSPNDEDNRLTYYSFMDNSRNYENFRDIFQENLDLQKNKDEGGITNSKIKEEYKENKKKKTQDRIYSYYDY